MGKIWCQLERLANDGSTSNDRTKVSLENNKSPGPEIYPIYETGSIPNDWLESIFIHTSKNVDLHKCNDLRVTEDREWFTEAIAFST